MLVQSSTILENNSLYFSCFFDIINDGDIMICPICKEKLDKQNNVFRCINNHSFDISKYGYVNLLTSKPNAGDNKELVNARVTFLNAGYYSALAIVIRDIFQEYNASKILDAGCGTGYYLSFLSDFDVYGVDISKLAIEKAAKTNKKGTFVVASTQNVPFENEFFSGILSVFAPKFEDEYFRLLEKDGIVVIVLPGKEHLFELKQAIYDNPYYNKEATVNWKKFSFLEKRNVKQIVSINQEHLLTLFSMTPYAYKTKSEDVSKLNHLNELSVTLDFDIFILKKAN